MNKSFRLAIAIMVLFVAALWFEKPIREWLEYFEIEYRTAKFISGSIVRLLLITVAIGLIKKLKTVSFCELNQWRNVKNIHAVFIAFVFITVGVASNLNHYLNVTSLLLFLFIIMNLCVGILEELVFRGLVFPLMIKAFKDNKNAIILSAIISSLMFGAIHFINLFSEPNNIVGITSQVFFATAIGVYFCGLLVRTENIIIPIVIHVFVNLSFGAGDLKPLVETVTKSTDTLTPNWGSIVPTTLFFSFIFIGGLYMIFKSNQAKVLQTL